MIDPRTPVVVSARDLKKKERGVAGKVTGGRILIFQVRK